MKTAAILLTMLIGAQSFNHVSNTMYTADKIEIVKNNSYKGKDLEALFKITYIMAGTNEKRFFEVVKTNNSLKNFFLADYILIEKINARTEYYPLGWTTSAIRENSIRSNCQSIVKGDVKPMKPE